MEVSKRVQLEVLLEPSGVRLEFRRGLLLEGLLEPEGVSAARGQNGVCSWGFGGTCSRRSKLHSSINHAMQWSLD